MIEIRNLSVRYGANQNDREAISNVHLTVPDGTVCAVIGPSGCGKSTMLKAVAGILTPNEGEILMDGKPLSPKVQSIGFMPQSYGLMPWRTAMENIRLGIRIKGGRSKDSEEEILSLMERLGIAELRDRYPRELSGGQQQRVALARVFLLRPDVLLMDEPFSALDAITREDMQEVFLALWHSLKVTTLLVTHYVEEALYLGERIVLMQASPGRIAEVMENPLAGSEGLRANPAFFEKGRQLREKIKQMGGYR